MLCFIQRPGDLQKQQTDILNTGISSPARREERQRQAGILEQGQAALLRASHTSRLAMFVALSFSSITLSAPSLGAELRP